MVLSLAFGGFLTLMHLSVPNEKLEVGTLYRLLRVLSVHFSPVLTFCELYPPCPLPTSSSVFSGVLWVIPRFPLPEMCLGGSPDSKLEYQAFTLFPISQASLSSITWHLNILKIVSCIFHNLLVIPSFVVNSLPDFHLGQKPMSLPFP